MSLLPHIEDAFRAARHEAEREYPGPTMTAPTRAEADEDAAQPMTVQPRDCSCGACLTCGLRESRERAWARAWDGRAAE